MFHDADAFRRLQINIYINHWGKFQMRLCPLSDLSTATELRELSDACLDQVTLLDGIAHASRAGPGAPVTAG